MNIDRIKVAEAIRNIKEDPLTCYNILDELQLKPTKENKHNVEFILKDLIKRGWLSNSVNNLYFRTFQGFRVK